MKRSREAGALVPEHGARFVLELVEGAVGSARYAVTIEAEGAARTTATLGAGSVELAPWDREVEPWAQESALGFLRTLAKNHAAEGDWPAVLRRWRSSRD